MRYNLLCCPVSVPHRFATPGMVVLGLVIVSSSLAVPQSPSVSGPARTAVSKSNLWILRIRNGLKYRMSHRYWANFLFATRTREPGPVHGNLDINRSLVWDPYSETWTRTRELWIWPVLVYVLRFPSTTLKCGSISMGHRYGKGIRNLKVSSHFLQNKW